MKFLVFTLMFIFSSSAFADFSISANEMNTNRSSLQVMDKQKIINASASKQSEELDKIRELACKNREQILRKHASKMP